MRFLLTGEYATEVSDASGMSLLDVEKRTWSKEMLSALEIPAAWLPTCTESDQVSGRISESAAKVTGLKVGTPVVGGGGDQAAQAVGSGIVTSGVISVTSGTSGVVFAHSDHYAAEAQGRLHAFCHAVPGKWHYMGVMLSAGGSFRWLRDAIGDVEKAAAQLIGVDPYELLTQEAASAPVGSEGLLFLPYLTGERTPYPDPQARGAFVGLTLRHGKAHLVRSVLEGVSFGLRDSLELIKGLGVPIAQVRASGGGARSAVWRQIQADVFGAELVLVNVTEGAAFGAALLAGVGAGAYRSVEEAVAATVKVTDRTAPIAANAQSVREVVSGVSRFVSGIERDVPHAIGKLTQWRNDARALRILSIYCAFASRLCIMPSPLILNGAIARVIRTGCASAISRCAASADHSSSRQSTCNETCARTRCQMARGKSAQRMHTGVRASLSRGARPRRRSTAPRTALAQRVAGAQCRVRRE